MTSSLDDDLGLNISVPWFESSEPVSLIPPSKKQQFQQQASSVAASSPSTLGFASSGNKRLNRQQKLELKRAEKQQRKDQKKQQQRQQHEGDAAPAEDDDEHDNDAEENGEKANAPDSNTNNLASLGDRFAVPNAGNQGLSLTRQEKKVKPVPKSADELVQEKKDEAVQKKKQQKAVPPVKQYQAFVRDPVPGSTTSSNATTATTKESRSPFDDKTTKQVAIAQSAIPREVQRQQQQPQQPPPGNSKTSEPTKKETTPQVLPQVQQQVAEPENRKQRRQRERDERENEKEETETELTKAKPSSQHQKAENSNRNNHSNSNNQQQQDDNKDSSSSAAPLPVPTSEEIINHLLHPRVKSAVVEKLGFTSLTYVQRESFPHISNPDGGDVVIRSETGSGKTLAYALPLVNQIVRDADTERIDRSFGTLMIVMAPTRELAEQCSDVITKLVARAAFVVVGSIHGGDDRHGEKNRLRKGIHILVCTPGRLLDHLKLTNSFTRDHLRYVVMDEADRLLDMGFERTIAEIMTLIPHPRKRILVSATVTSAVERLKHFVLEPPVVTVGKTEDVFEVPDTLTQKFVNVPPKHRLVALASLLWSKLLTATAPAPAPGTSSSSSASAPQPTYSTYVPPNRLTKAAHQRIVCFVSTSDAVEFLYLLFSRLASPFYTSASNNKYANNAANGHQHGGGANQFQQQQQQQKISVKKLTESANQHLYSSQSSAGGVVDFNDDYYDDDGVAMDPRVARAQYLHRKQEEQKAAAANKEFLLSDEDSFLRGADVFKLHGNMAQVDRQAVYENFKKSACAVLFCTDVAARGLDIPNVDLIVHYDPPIDERSYVHRVGRTARIGTSGESILFLMPHEIGYVNFLSRATRRTSDDAALAGADEDEEVEVEVPVDADEDTAGSTTAGAACSKRTVVLVKRPKKLLMPEINLDVILFTLTKMDRKAGPGRHWVHSAAFLQKAMCDLTRVDPLLRQVSLFAYQSSIRAYAGMPREVKRYFDQRQLHLGHIASSFANNSTPAQLQRDLRAAEQARKQRHEARDATKIKHQGVSKMWDAKARDGEMYYSTLMKKAMFETKNRVDEGTASGMKQSATASKVMTEFEA